MEISEKKKKSKLRNVCANLSPSTLSRIRAPVTGFRLHILTGDKRVFGCDLKSAELLNSSSLLKPL